MQCDASETGLGAALTQNGKPVAYASRALTAVECRYTQIEKELLAVVFGMEKFHCYTFERKVTVQSDHKPLEIIMTKPLHHPKRLQSMLLRLQCYDFSLVYQKGKLMYPADTLSHAYLPDVQATVFEEEVESMNMVEHLMIGEEFHGDSEALKRIQHNTETDGTMQALKAFIQSGWPAKEEDVPVQVIPYFHIRDGLSIEDGIVFRAERVVVPKACRKEMLTQIHSSHIGTEGCLRRARVCLYWPRMNTEVIDHASQCDVCRACDDKQQKETWMPHSVPSRPWAKVGVDLFVFDEWNYLVTVDYFSNLIIWKIHEPRGSLES